MLRIVDSTGGVEAHRGPHRLAGMRHRPMALNSAEGHDGAHACLPSLPVGCIGGNRNR